MAEVTVFGSPFIDLAYGFPLGDAREKLKAGVDLKMAPGGPAANVATGLARLGVEVSLFGKVGADWFGEYVRASLGVEGVETSNLTLETGESSSVIFPIVDENGEQRSYELLNDPVQFELDTAGLKNCLEETETGGSYLFADGVMLLEEPSSEALVEATEIAAEEEVSVVFDPNLRLPTRTLEARVHFLEAILQNSDYLLLNEAELETLREVIRPGNEVKQEIMDHGLETLVVKKGSCGHEVLPRSGASESEYGSFEVEVVDQQGAGDGFDAGFIAGLEYGMDVNRASLMGSAVGALACSGMTAWEPLPDLDELRKFLKEEDENELARKL